MTCNLDPIDSFLAVTDYSATSPRTMKNSAGQVGIAPHNLILASEDFSDSNWTKTNTTVTPNAAAAPDGTITADEISHTSTSASLEQTVTVVTGQDYMNGLFMKYIDHQWISIQSDGGLNAWYDIQNGVLGTDNSNGASIVALSDGWYYLTLPTTAPDATRSMKVFLSSADASTTETSGTSAYIWGAHLYENGLAGMFDVPEDQRALASLTKYLPNKAVVTGPNLVSNGTFDSNTNGWTATNSSLSVVDGRLRVTISSNGVGGAYQAIPTVAGAIYYVSATLSNPTGPANDAGISAGTTAVGVELGQYWEAASAGKVDFYFTATGDTTYITPRLSFDPSDYCDFDNITVTKVDRDPTAARYLPRRNNHEYIDGAWTQGLKAESEARTNLVTEAFDFSAGTAGNITISSNASSGQDGNVTADHLVEDSTTNLHRIQMPGQNISGAHTLSVRVKKSSTRRLLINADSVMDAKALFDLTSGSESVVATSGTASDLNAVVYDMGDFLLCSITGTGTGTTQGYYFQLCESGHATTSDDSYLGDGSSYLAVYGAQLEAGSTPSSLIPTYGATRTRTAETFTQNDVIWPNTTYVDGTELVTNGTFDSDVSGWTATDCTLAAVSGELEVTYSAATQWVDQQLSGLTAGNVYELSFSVRSDDITSGLNATVGTSQFDTSVLNISLSPTTSSVSYTYVFVAGSTSDYVSFFSSMSSGQKYYVDNISVKEINPRALAVVMHGYVTYADEGDFATVMFWRQYEDASNNIEFQLDTDGVDVGGLRVRQEVNGTVDLCTTNDTYSPGVNVPFKIASRHLDNAVQGAADGTATTENTTPPGLPDLSSTQAEWFYDFMGHITFVGKGQEASADRLDSTNGPTTLTTATGGSFLA